MLQRCVTVLGLGLLWASAALLPAVESGAGTPPAPTPPDSTAPAATAPAATPVPVKTTGGLKGDPATAGPRTYAPINPNALNPAANDMALSASDVFAPVIEAGEVLEFTITVSPTGMVAGKNLLKVQAIRPLANDPKTMVYDITSTIRSSRLFDMVYKVKIDINTLMNVKEGFSQFYQYSGLEGATEHNERIEMDYSGEQAKAYYYGDVEAGETHRDARRTLPLPGRVQDPLNALYALRGAKMEVGKDILMTVTTEERNFPLIIKVLKIEEIEVADLGKRKCYRMEPIMRFGGLFTRKGKLWFWVDQETQVPVRLEVEIPVGKAVGSLTHYEHSPFDKLKAKGGDGVKPSGPAGPAAPVPPVVPATTPAVPAPPATPGPGAPVAPAGSTGGAAGEPPVAPAKAP